MENTATHISTDADGRSTVHVTLPGAQATQAKLARWADRSRVIILKQSRIVSRVPLVVEVVVREATR